jgi:hypothetical protein
MAPLLSAEFAKRLETMLYPRFAEAEVLPAEKMPDHTDVGGYAPKPAEY